MWQLFQILLFNLLAGCEIPAAERASVYITEGQDCQHYYNSRLKTKVYTKVEIEAEYEGGAPAYQRFLNKHLRIPPKHADLNELQSTISMEFIVDTTGRLLLPGISGKSDSCLHTPLEKEAVRLLRLMPNWKPAHCNGKKVASLVKRPMVICYEETP